MAGHAGQDMGAVLTDSRALADLELNARPLLHGTASPQTLKPGLPPPGWLFQHHCPAGVLLKLSRLRKSTTPSSPSTGAVLSPMWKW